MGVDDAVDGGAPAADGGRGGMFAGGLDGGLLVAPCCCRWRWRALKLSSMRITSS